MVEVIGVRFRTAGKIYFFNPKGISGKVRRPRDRGKLPEELNLDQSFLREDR